MPLDREGMIGLWPVGTRMILRLAIYGPYLTYILGMVAAVIRRSQAQSLPAHVQLIFRLIVAELKDFYWAKIFSHYLVLFRYYWYGNQLLLFYSVVVSDIFTCQNNTVWYENNTTLFIFQLFKFIYNIWFRFYLLIYNFSFFEIFWRKIQFHPKFFYWKMFLKG